MVNADERPAPTHARSVTGTAASVGEGRAPFNTRGWPRAGERGPNEKTPRSHGTSH